MVENGSSSVCKLWVLSAVIVGRFVYKITTAILSCRKGNQALPFSDIPGTRAQTFLCKVYFVF